MAKERFLTVLVPIKDSDCEPTVFSSLASLSSAIPASEANINKIYKLSKDGYARVWMNPSSGVYEYHIVTDREFPYLGNPLEIFDFTYDATRMGTEPTISAQGVMRYADADGSTLDGLWTLQCHVVFNGKKLYLKQIPTSSKSNEDARYKYDMDFVDESVVLERVYIYDVVSPFVTGRPVSESSVFSFYGDINELAKCVNASLIRSGLASLTRKYVHYDDPYYEQVLPSTIIPYLTYEQWNMMNVNPMSLVPEVFGSDYEWQVFRYEIYRPLNGDYNSYLLDYIYENDNGVYALTGYQCKIGNDKYGNLSTSEEKLITFENNTIYEALQQFHDTFELEYYITCEKDSSGNVTGNTWIMVADCEHDFADIDPLTGDFVRDDEGIPVSTHPFEYGDTEALLSKEKSNTTDKIVTRITGVGSTENIPWYYPNPNPDGWLRPFYTEYGVEIPNITIDYPIDEGSSIADALLYEKFLKNRIGVPIKRGVVKEVLFKTDYDAALPVPDENYYILVFYYKINTNGIEIPRITLELDYNPLESKCSRLAARLMRDGSTVALYDSSESYADPTPFQTMFDTKDGKHWSGLMSGKNYTLQVGYYIPKSEMPLSQIADYEGHLYPSAYYDEWGSLIGVRAYVGQNFYDSTGLTPFLEFYPSYPTPGYPGPYELTDTGYSVNGEPSGKSSPIPRLNNKHYKDLSTGKIYRCTTFEPVNINNGANKDAFEEDPIMSGDEWFKSFVSMRLRVYDNDGWYINNKRVQLEDYGVSSPYQPGAGVPVDIFNAIEFQRLKWVTPLPNLMPEVFIKTDGERRFYSAHNYWDKDNESLYDGVADTMIGEVQTGSQVRNPIYKEDETDPDNKHYDFESQYRQSMPHEHIENFDDVKPTIEGQLNDVDGTPLRIDVVEMFDYDTTDNNEIWDSDEEDTIQGDYKHPYFFAKLRPMGFNIFDLATTDDMVLSMTTGNCGACNFKIGVDERTGKNPVQIWEHDVYSYDGTTYTKVYDAGTLRRYMNLTGLYYETEGEYVPVSSNMLIDGGGQSDYLTNLYDRYTYSENDVKNGLVGGVKQEGKKHFGGDVVTSGKFIDSQQDTSENYVWVALMKDTESYGVIMPSAIPNYNDPTYNQYIEPKGIEYTNRANGEQSTLTEDQADKFVLTNIRLPQMYLRRAEHKLSRELVKYMYEHNWQRFNFSIKFSRIYIAGNPATDDYMNENSVLYVTFNGTVYRQYAKHYSYRMSHDSPLPETNVDMNEDLSVSRTLLQQWDRKLGKGGHSALVHVNNVANRTRDLAQKHYLGKYDDLVNPSSSSQGGTTNIYNEELEWGEF